VNITVIENIMCKYCKNYSAKLNAELAEKKRVFNVFYLYPTLLHVCKKSMSVNIAIDNSITHLEIVCDSTQILVHLMILEITHERQDALVGVSVLLALIWRSVSRHHLFVQYISLLLDLT